MGRVRVAVGTALLVGYWSVVAAVSVGFRVAVRAAIPYYVVVSAAAARKWPLDPSFRDESSG